VGAVRLCESGDVARRDDDSHAVVVVTWRARGDVREVRTTRSRSGGGERGLRGIDSHRLT
jgi:hypothetical protein